MATIQRFPFVRHRRSEPTYHGLRYRNGDLRRDGAGLAFWFRPIASAVAEVPSDDRELPFLFRVRSADFQELTVQGVIIFRVAPGRARPARGLHVVLALNEIFAGHETHQSARHTIALGDRAERQSSSGVIAATGTGATGWAASNNRQLAQPLTLPAPTDPALTFFVREAWQSSVTGTTLTAGRITAAQHLTITCELGEGGTVLGDGIEADHVAVDWGQRIEIGAASRTLRLVG